MRASLVVASVLVAAGVAHAQDAGSAQPPPGPSQAPSQHATELFEQGRKLLAQDHVQEACATFDESIRLDPTAAGTMLNLGLCNEKLGKFKTALFWFRRGQTRAAETNLPDAERAAKEHTASLATKVATIHIAFSGPSVDGTTVKIDDDEIKPEEYGRVEVDPGHHVLVARAPGKKIAKQEFDVSGTGGQTLTISLVTGDNVVVIDRGRGRRRAALYLLIAGGTLLAADAVVAIDAHVQYCADVKPCPGLFGTNPNEVPKPPHTAAEANSAKSLALYGGTTLFAAGAAAIAAASILYFTAPQPERIDQTVFAPVIGSGQVGVALSRGF